MKTLKLGSLCAVASAAMIGIAACAGESAGPGSMLAPTSAARHEVGEPADNVPQTGHLKLCKEGNVDGTFTVTRAPFGTASSGAVISPVTVEAGQCKIVATDVSAVGSASDIVINETSEGFVSASYVGTDVGESGTYTNNVTALRINPFHGYVVTYVNHVEEEVPGCTYTKGWYRNKNGSQTIIDGIDGLDIATQQTIFGATPGKPNGVTWGADNNNLNLYQQLLAALNNLGGNATGGPDAVDDAIEDALAATSVSGLAITVAAGTDVSGLISVLSSFNEGEFAGWPHCDD